MVYKSQFNKLIVYATFMSFKFERKEKEKNMKCVGIFFREIKKK